MKTSNRRVTSRRNKKMLEEIKENMIEKIKEIEAIESIKQAPAPIFDDKTQQEKIIEVAQKDISPIALQNDKKIVFLGQTLLKKNRCGIQGVPIASQTSYFMQNRAFK
jgi:hypothetical protein